MARILIVGEGLVLEALGDVGCLSEVKWLPHYDGVDVLDAAAVIYSVGVLGNQGFAAATASTGWRSRAAQL